MLTFPLIFTTEATSYRKWGGWGVGVLKCTPAFLTGSWAPLRGQRSVRNKRLQFHGVELRRDTGPLHYTTSSSGVSRPWVWGRHCVLLCPRHGNRGCKMAVTKSSHSSGEESVCVCVCVCPVFRRQPGLGTQMFPGTWLSLTHP